MLGNIEAIVEALKTAAESGGLDSGETGAESDDE
jgi:hypothetical protein